MKRLFYQSKIYDYTSIEQAEKHKEEMEQKGWSVREYSTINGEYCKPYYLFENGQDEYAYSIEYHKQR